jgi:hypothetical protein
VVRSLSSSHLRRSSNSCWLKTPFATNSGSWCALTGSALGVPHSPTKRLESVRQLSSHARKALLPARVARHPFGPCDSLNLRIVALLLTWAFTPTHQMCRPSGGWSAGPCGFTPAHAMCRSPGGCLNETSGFGGVPADPRLNGSESNARRLRSGFREALRVRAAPRPRVQHGVGLSDVAQASINHVLKHHGMGITCGVRRWGYACITILPNSTGRHSMHLVFSG